jgi:hypothetical protein
MQKPRECRAVLRARFNKKEIFILKSLEMHTYPPKGLNLKSHTAWRGTIVNFSFGSVCSA